jgi:hypothetical protein
MVSISHRSCRQARHEAELGPGTEWTRHSDSGKPRNQDILDNSTRPGFYTEYVPS